MIGDQRVYDEDNQYHMSRGKCNMPKVRKSPEMGPLSDSHHHSTKRLRFSETSTLVLTPPPSNDDMENSWYGKQAINQFKQDTKAATKALRDTRTAKAMKHVAYSIATKSPESEIHVNDSELIRGIEHLLSLDILKLLFQRRRLTIARVLEEQAIQKISGQSDPSKIAQISLDNSNFSKEWCCRVLNLQEP